MTTQKRCKACGAIFIKLPSHSKKYFKIRKYCSLKCRPSDFRNKSTKRKKNFNWKGGKYKHTKGYILILKPNHPFCDSKGYVFEHRLVLEKHLKRHLKPSEYTHHINSIIDDNRIENLYLCKNNSEHKSMHKQLNQKKRGTKLCLQCGKNMQIERTVDIVRKKFCSQSCASRYNAIHQKRYKKEFGYTKCLQCSKITKNTRAKQIIHKKFCSRFCAGKFKNHTRPRSTNGCFS